MAYAAGVPRISARIDADTAMTVLLVRARTVSGVPSWSIQLLSVGVKFTQGMPKPATVNVSIGLRSDCENAQ